MRAWPEKRGKSGSPAYLLRVTACKTQGLRDEKQNPTDKATGHHLETA